MSNILILYFSIIIKKEIKLIYYSYVIIAIKNITQMYVKGDMSASLIKSFVIVFVLIEICMTIYWRRPKSIECKKRWALYCLTVTQSIIEQKKKCIAKKKSSVNKSEIDNHT